MKIPPSELNFEHFKTLALDNSLSDVEKIGFTKEVRHGLEKIIFEDICSKVPAFIEKNALLLDIGCGSSSLVNLFLENAQKQNQQLFLLDSEEMLSKFDAQNNLLKGKFPHDFSNFLAENFAQFDAVIAYSVAHYVYKEDDLILFVDKALSLLKKGGVFLLGDIPNADKRRRFFESEEGNKAHLNYLKSNNLPLDTPLSAPTDNIPEMELKKLVDYFINKGFSVHFAEQSVVLPMHNRRDDILFIKQ